MTSVRCFVLIHSPLVGPVTWSRVAAVLRHRRVDVRTPSLSQDETSAEPLWRQQAQAAAQELRAIRNERAVVLVAHSGAGQLLPAIREDAARPVAAYVFVDAGIPHDAQARLRSGASSDAIRAMYARGERFPNWTEETLRDVVPEPNLRSELVRDIRKQPWRFWTEPIRVFAGWPDAPCAYLRFTPNPTYDDDAAEARARGWAFAELAGQHFHMLVEPDSVTDALQSIVDGMLGS